MTPQEIADFEKAQEWKREQENKKQMHKDAACVIGAAIIVIGIIIATIIAITGPETKEEKPDNGWGVKEIQERAKKEKVCESVGGKYHVTVLGGASC